MNRIKNIRPGVLVIPDAGLKLKPGQVVEVERLTKQIQAALKNGRLAMADKPKQEPLAPPEPDQDAEPVDLSKLSATDAIPGSTRRPIRRPSKATWKPKNAAR
jgi:hypothetical protein